MGGWYFQATQGDGLLMTYNKVRETRPPWHLEVRPVTVIKTGEQKYGISLISQMGYNVAVYPNWFTREIFDTRTEAERFLEEHKEEILNWMYRLEEE